MTLIPGERPSSKVIIGPVTRCGYVCLINGVEEKKANCEVITAVISKQVRIIIYTSKQIAKGEELCYYYGKGSKFGIETLSNLELK